MGVLNSRMFKAGDGVYRFIKQRSPSHKWKLYRLKEGTTGEWKVLKQDMSKAEAERMNKLLRG